MTDAMTTAERPRNATLSNSFFGADLAVADPEIARAVDLETRPAA